MGGMDAHPATGHNEIDWRLYGEKHPEWFSEIEGKRIHERAQLCLTNDALRKELIKNLKARLRANPSATIASVSQNDWHKWCTCKNCAAVDEAEGSQAPLGGSAEAEGALGPGTAEEFETETPCGSSAEAKDARGRGRKRRHGKTAKESEPPGGLAQPEGARSSSKQRGRRHRRTAEGLGSAEAEGPRDRCGKRRHRGTAEAGGAEGRRRHRRTAERRGSTEAAEAKGAHGRGKKRRHHRTAEERRPPSPSEEPPPPPTRRRFPPPPAKLPPQSPPRPSPPSSATSVVSVTSETESASLEAPQEQAPPAKARPSARRPLVALTPAAGVAAAPAQIAPPSRTNARRGAGRRQVAAGTGSASSQAPPVVAPARRRSLVLYTAGFKYLGKVSGFQTPRLLHMARPRSSKPCDEDFADAVREAKQAPAIKIWVVR